MMVISHSFSLIFGWFRMVYIFFSFSYIYLMIKYNFCRFEATRQIHSMETKVNELITSGEASSEMCGNVAHWQIPILAIIADVIPLQQEGEVATFIWRREIQPSLTVKWCCSFHTTIVINSVFKI